MPSLKSSLSVWRGVLVFFLILSLHGNSLAGPGDPKENADHEQAGDPKEPAPNFSKDKDMVYDVGKTYTDKPSYDDAKEELAKILKFIHEADTEQSADDKNGSQAKADQKSRKEKKAEKENRNDKAYIKYSTRLIVLMSRIYFLNDRILAKGYSKAIMKQYLRMTQQDHVKSFGHFWVSLAAAHVVKASYKHGLSLKVILELCQEFPNEAVHYASFSAGASTANFAFDVAFQKMSKGYGYFSKRSLQEAVQRKLTQDVSRQIENPMFPTSKRIALREALAQGAKFGGKYGLVKGQLGLLAGTLLNIVLYQKNLTVQQVIDQAVTSQTGFLAAQILVRKGLLNGLARTLRWIEIKKEIKSMEKALKMLRTTPTVVSVIAMTVEFVICDLLIDHAIMPVVQSSEAYGAFYESMYRLDAGVRGKKLDAMTSSPTDPCDDVENPQQEMSMRVECYRSQVKYNFQHYLKTIVFSNIGKIREASIQEQNEIDSKYQMGLMTKRFGITQPTIAEEKMSTLSFAGVNKDNAEEFNNLAQWKFGVVTTSDIGAYDSRLLQVWKKYLNTAKVAYVKHYQTIDGNIILATKLIDAKINEREVLEKCIELIEKKPREFTMQNAQVVVGVLSDCMPYVLGLDTKTNTYTKEDKLARLETFLKKTSEDQEIVINEAQKQNEKLFEDIIQMIRDLIKSADLKDFKNEYDQIRFRRLKIDLPLPVFPRSIPLNQLMMGKILKLKVSYGDIIKSLLTGMKVIDDLGKTDGATETDETLIRLFDLIREEIMRKNALLRYEQPDMGLASLALLQEGLWVKPMSMSKQEWLDQMNQETIERKRKSPLDGFAKNYQYLQSLKPDNTASIVVTNDQYKRDDQALDKSLRMMIYRLAKIQKCEAALANKSGTMSRDDNLTYDHDNDSKLRKIYGGEYGYVLKRYYEESKPNSIHEYQYFDRLPKFDLPVTNREYVTPYFFFKKPMEFVSDASLGLNIQQFIMNTTPRLTDDYLFKFQKQVGVSYEDLKKLHPLIQCPSADAQQ